MVSRFEGSLKTAYGLTDALQSEKGWIQVGYGNPQHFSGIVGRHSLSVAVYGTLEKQIHGRDGKLTVHVSVGEREEKDGPFNGKSGLFHHFADDGFLGGFTDIGKAPRKVERTLARILGPPYHQELLLLIEDKSRNSCTGIEKKLKSAILASATFLR